MRLSVGLHFYVLPNIQIIWGPSELDRALSLFGGVTTSGLSAAGAADTQTSLSLAPAYCAIAFKDWAVHKYWEISHGWLFFFTLNLSLNCWSDLEEWLKLWRGFLLKEQPVRTQPYLSLRWQSQLPKAASSPRAPLIMILLKLPFLKKFDSFLKSAGSWLLSTSASFQQPVIQGQPLQISPFIWAFLILPVFILHLSHVDFHSLWVGFNFLLFEVQGKLSVFIWEALHLLFKTFLDYCAVFKI